MNCEFHKDREAVAKCKVCGKDLCEECNKVNQKYSACPSCAKSTLQTYHQNIKRGLMFNVLSIICSVAFVVMYVVALALQKLNLGYIIAGAIIIAILVPASIFMLCYSLRNMKEYKATIDIADAKEQKNDQE